MKPFHLKNSSGMQLVKLVTSDVRVAFLSSNRMGAVPISPNRMGTLAIARVSKGYPSDWGLLGGALCYDKASRRRLY